MSLVSPAGRSTTGDGERSVGELFGTLASDTSTLVRQEVKLATEELTAKAKQAGQHTMVVASGAFLALLGLQTLLAALVLGLAFVMPIWLAALVVGGVLTGIALGIAMTGIAALKKMDFTPTHTLSSIEENKTWARKQIQ